MNDRLFISFFISCKNQSKSERGKATTSLRNAIGEYYEASIISDLKSGGIRGQLQYKDTYRRTDDVLRMRNLKVYAKMYQN